MWAVVVISSRGKQLGAVLTVLCGLQQREAVGCCVDCVMWAAAEGSSWVLC